MNTLFALTKTTVLIWVRDKVFYSILVVSVLTILCSLFLNEMIVGDKSKIVNDLGLSVMLYLGIFLTLFTITNPGQDKTLYMILSKPFPRGFWLLGNYFGNTLILLVNTLIMTALMVALVQLSGGTWIPDVGWAIYLIYLELLLMVAVCIFFSTFMNSPALSKFCTLSVFLVGHITEEVKLIMEAGKNETLEALFKTLYYTFPNLSVFDIKTEAVHQLGLDTGHLIYATCYGLAYTTLLLLICNWRFKQVDM